MSETSRNNLAALEPELGGCGISNGRFAAVAAGSLALGAALMGAVWSSGALAEGGSAGADIDGAALVESVGASSQLAATADDALGTAGARALRGARMAQAEKSVVELVGGYGEDVAVSVRMLGAGPSFDVNGDEAFQSASMIKLSVLAEYLDETQDGELSPAETYTLDAGDVVGGSGSMQDDPLGTTYSLDEVAGRMISQSDNVGTNVLIERMGVDAVDEKAAELGLSQTSLAHKLMIAANDGRYNLTSANDCAAILEHVWAHDLAGDERCLAAETWLLAQEDDEGIAQGLPDGIAFGHKTGTVDGVRHDGGIVYAEEPYVICVFTRGLGYDAANALMAQVSSAVYDALR